MTVSTMRLLEEAMQLPEPERADLVARLLDSLESDTDSDAEAAWSQEILRRVTELRTGQVKSIPWQAARQMILDDRDDAG